MLAKMTKVTAFTTEELNIVHTNFSKLSAMRTADKLIDKQEFCIMMNASPSMNSAFIDALFKMFDADSSGGIDLEEFVVALAIYQNKAKSVPEVDKQKLFFKLYDIDGDGQISQNDLASNLRSCFAASHMKVADEDINALVKSTFAKYTLTAAGTIDFAAFSKSAFKL
jgi:Ca2+-binding EF-hand superfamily protein